MLASAQIHPCDERRERTGEQGEGGGRGRGGEEEEKGKEEEEEEERATDVSGDVQRSQRTSGSLHAAAHTNHPGWLHKYLAPIFSLIIPSCFITTTIVENVPLQRIFQHSTGCFPAAVLLKMWDCHLKHSFEHSITSSLRPT